jgi:hypothetical protein
MPKTTKVDSTILTAEFRLLINKLNFYATSIQCTKCANSNTFQHIGNSTHKPTKPTIKCSNCQYKPYISFFEREIKNLEHTTPYVPETAASSSKKLTATKQATKPVTTTNQQAVETATTTISNNTDKSNPLTTQIGVLTELVRSLQDRLGKMEVKLKNTDNRNASLDQSMVKMKKIMQLHNIDLEEHHLEDIYEEDSDTEMDINNVHETQKMLNAVPQKSVSTPILKSGSGASKWANVDPSITTTTTITNKNKPNTNNTKKVNNNNNNKNINKNKNTKKTKTPINNKAKFTYADIVTQNKKVDNTIKKINIASRAFFVPTPEQKGYEYIYFPCRARISRKSQRKNLKTLGVQNGRILDIHYPSGNVIAILIHKMYKTQFLQTMQSAGIKKIENYDPTNPEIITNPELHNLTLTEKKTLATEKFNQRLIRALPFIRSDFTKKSVANFFFSNNWITEEQLNNFLSTIKSIHTNNNFIINNTPTNDATTAQQTQNIITEDANMEEVLTNNINIEENTTSSL